MMNNYSENITADSFSGIVFALEGIKNSVVLINGPAGRKLYHSAVPDSQSIHQQEFDPLKYPEKFYFGQPRVPCTYLDSRDYVYGSSQKLNEALEFIYGNVDFELLAIVNSPGAALIGDDLKSIAKKFATDKKCMIIETPGFSGNMCSGYEKAAMEALKQLSFSQKEQSPFIVNILGMSVYHKYYRGDKEEISRLMNMCGIEINCFLCAGSSLESIENLPKARLNIVLHPEYGLETAALLEEMYGTPYYVCSGPPIGFKATEKFVRDICRLLGCSSYLFDMEAERARAAAYMHISRVNSLTGLPKGVSFAIEGTCSEIYSYTSFLVRYFGMVAESVRINCEETGVFMDMLQSLFSVLGLSDALHRDTAQTSAELVFAGGNTIARLKLRKHRFSGIETALPSLGYIDVILKTHLGLRGALLITEQVLNGLKFD